MCNIQRELEQLVRDPGGTICRSVGFGAVLNAPLGKMCAKTLFVRLILQSRAVVGDVVGPYAYLDVLDF